jgi:hypothetical protein
MTQYIVKINFYLSFSLAAALMLACYGAVVFGLKKLGINL